MEAESEEDDDDEDDDGKKVSGDIMLSRGSLLSPFVNVYELFIFIMFMHFTLNFIGCC